LSKRLGFLPNEDSSLIEPKVVETEKVLNGLGVLCEMFYSLQPSA
jgi:hypothetical protein